MGTRGLRTRRAGRLYTYDMISQQHPLAYHSVIPCRYPSFVRRSLSERHRRRIPCFVSMIPRLVGAACLRTYTGRCGIRTSKDAFKDNFLVQWHPESLSAGHIPRSRSRVFLTDFEVAVMFSTETPLKDCLFSGFPIGVHMRTT
ncbi:hypothetical protein C8Q79DRAFT_637427 [Trametes meyenii]|nr:hypothetical protein C8Q79DRAFT_637427 [Trametes meyenii]